MTAQVQRKVVKRQVVTRESVPRPGDSRTQPTSFSSLEEDELLLRLPEVVIIDGVASAEISWD
jgi:hypothetical protein